MISRLLVALLALLLGSAPVLSAQSGALFLLVPFGARAVSMGEAISADTTLGSEGIWWNAAALARLPSKEVALHYSQTLLANSVMVSVAVPSRIFGTLALSGYDVNYGDQQATDPFNGQPIGVISNHNYLLAASYATPVGKRLSLGVSYKFLVLRFACSGACGNTPVLSGKTSALDMGVQYVVPTAFPLTLGFSARNIGPALQIKDKPQADPLPLVIQGGVMSRLPIASLKAAGASLDVSADILKADALGGTNIGIGASLGYQDQYFLRAGYKRQQGDGSGPSIGIGLQRGALGIDLSRRFDRLSAQLGETPTYITLRGRF
ncbi:MAG: PorV/PorQ family protein [Gemmatimonadaceae bacterium]|nr:PorV/PorQ family protein [Gemmatimonadaceae bacterium]